ncbi:cationic amino acid transporter 4-like [Asterias rubens]|uniref:cationic amino acid transporter 4-like n=1 Tax=Asterias rubens TaxID=7604 RepID=UPI001455C661|nr:cationic amino acid transporter 4-like [Asterias rubens]XP_033642572.1 cationic amino acid transporter 4-like [Asterias rubens]XP_033642573.1 cationic amino acid transporter 4-like [Asterias rubens]
MACSNVIRNLCRLKTLDLSTDETKLKKCLSCLDLTLMGVSGMVGVTLYVLTGVVAKEIAGPSMVLSLVFGCLAAMLAALCYAELGSIFTKTGSAYLFTYSIIGEFPAFLVGWSILLEYILSTAVVASGWSGYLDSLTNHKISNFTVEVLMGGETWNTSFVTEVPDIVGGFVTLLILLVVGLGTYLSSSVNNVLLMINIGIVAFISIGGFIFADGNNWTERGFFPFGFGGTLSGAAIVFIGYVGFDIIAVSAEEAIDSHKNVPRAIIASLVIVAIIYTIVAVSLTLAVPFYEIDISAVLATPFVKHNLIWAKYIVDIGALCSMGACLVPSAYAMPRITYAMGVDGLLFKFFTTVHPTTRTPLAGTLCIGTFTTFLVVFFDLSTLSNVLSIGTLVAFNMVAVCVMFLRYQKTSLTRHILQHNTITSSQDGDADDEDDENTTRFLDNHDNDQPVTGGALKPRFQFLTTMNSYPPCMVPSVCIVTTTCLLVLLVAIGVIFMDKIKAGDWWVILLVIVLTVSTLLTFIPITLHEQVNIGSPFKTPLVPFIPVLSILINTMFIMQLSTATWIRFAIWIAIGTAIYLLYGYHHSVENLAVKELTVSEGQYTVLNNTVTDDVTDYVMKPSLVMPQPPRRKKEGFSK